MASALLRSLIEHISRTDIAALAIFVGLIAAVSRSARRRSSTFRLRTTNLKGPKSNNFIFGLVPVLAGSDNPGALVEGWIKEYGAVCSFPMAFGRKSVTLADVKAVAHMFARDTGVYRQTGLTKAFIENLFGRGILWAEEEDHRRQRKALTPAFSLAATRGYLNTFYDSAYKVKSNWEALLDNGNTTIEVQSWMNFASIDDIGIAGFGHDFGALDGNKPQVVRIFDVFERPESSGWVSRILFMLGPIFPVLQRLPAKHNRMMRGIKGSMAVLADTLIQGGKEGLAGTQEKATDKSIMGLLIKAETSESAGLSMSKEEVLSQMNTILFAGYETTSISLTWALIELARNPDKQSALRKELAGLQGADPTWENLTQGLPYLNGIAQVILRLHPAVPFISRVAIVDDILPLADPITTADGEVVSEIQVAKGTTVTCAVEYINQAEELWGPDAKKFRPERWIDGDIGSGARAIQGYHHLLTFADGPRLCLGRNFAVGNFKATLSVLIRNFTFELSGGVDTKIGKHRGLLVRPKVEGEDGSKVPLIVRRIE